MEHQPLHNRAPHFSHLLPAQKNIQYSFYRINEMIESTAEQSRLAMVNVIASLNKNQGSIVYFISGTPKGIDLYIGIAGYSKTIHDEGELLRQAFEGNF